VLGRDVASGILFISEGIEHVLLQYLRIDNILSLQCMSFLNGDAIQSIWSLSPVTESKLPPLQPSGSSGVLHFNVGSYPR